MAKKRKSERELINEYDKPDIDGVPYGLKLCQVCGEYTGTCMHPLSRNDHENRGLVDVICQCQQGNCPNCGNKLYKSRGTNYFVKGAGVIHVPIFHFECRYCGIPHEDETELVAAVVMERDMRVIWLINPSSRIYSRVTSFYLARTRVDGRDKVTKRFVEEHGELSRNGQNVLKVNTAGGADDSNIFYIDAYPWPGFTDPEKYEITDNPLETERAFTESLPNLEKPGYLLTLKKREGDPIERWARNIDNM